MHVLEVLNTFFVTFNVVDDSSNWMDLIGE